MQAIRHLIRFILLAACAALMHGCAAPAYRVTIVAGPGSAALGINEAGHTVGYLDTGGGIVHAFANKGAGAADLGTLGGSTSRAWAINAAGHVVGQSDTGDGANRAFFHDGSTMTDLGTLGGTDSVARAINDDGTIVGSARVPGDEWSAFSYSNGAMARLGTLPSSGRFYSFGYAINQAGLIGGSSSAGEYAAPDEAFDINNKSEVVGRSGGSTPFRGFLYRKGSMVALDTLVEPGWTFPEARGINDSGQIAATGCKAGVCHAVRLDPGK